MYVITTDVQYNFILNNYNEVNTALHRNYSPMYKIYIIHVLGRCVHIHMSLSNYEMSHLFGQWWHADWEVERDEIERRLTSHDFSLYPLLDYP